MRVAGRGHLRAPRARSLPSGHLAHVPDHQHLSRAHRARERADRDPAQGGRELPAARRPVAPVLHREPGAGEPRIPGARRPRGRCRRARCRTATMRLLELAMALAQRPTLLLVDEPTQGLSPEDTEAAVAVIRQIMKDARAHHPPRRARHGRRLQPGRPDQRAPPGTAHRRGQPGGDPGEPRGAEGLSRRAAHDAARGRGPSRRSTARARCCATSPSRCRAAEITALLGRNGAGKTTTLRSIMGLTPPRRGTVRFDGRDITGQPPHVVFRLGVGYVPEGRQIFPHLDVGENLRLAERVSRLREATGRSSGSSSTSRCSSSAGGSAGGACRAASSRCWPSRAPSPATPTS